jgi:hypothetical protein
MKERKEREKKMEALYSISTSTESKKKADLNSAMRGVIFFH